MGNFAIGGFKPRVPTFLARAAPSKIIMQATAAVNAESYDDEKPKFRPLYAYLVMSIILMIRVAT